MKKEKLKTIVFLIVVIGLPLGVYLTGSEKWLKALREASEELEDRLEGVYEGAPA